MRHAGEGVRIAEAESAMLAANALRMETEATHRMSSADIDRLRKENEAALAALARVLGEVNGITAELTTPA